MFDFIKLLRKETNMACTENGAASYRTTNSACLDLFSRAGAMRNACETDITELFMRAYAEDPDTAMKILRKPFTAKAGMRWAAQIYRRCSK